MDTDDLDPPRPTLKPVDLTSLSVHELEDYIASLEAEIARADAMIAQKKAHKNDMEGLFRKA